MFCLNASESAIFESHPTANFLAISRRSGPKSRARVDPLRVKLAKNLGGFSKISRHRGTRKITVRFDVAFDDIDEDGSGTIEYDEFVGWIYKEDLDLEAGSEEEVKKPTFEKLATRWGKSSEEIQGYYQEFLNPDPQRFEIPDFSAPKVVIICTLKVPEKATLGAQKSGISNR